MKSLFEQLGGTYTRQGDLLTAGVLDGHLADIEEQAQELFLRSERDRDAGNCIWVTSKRGSMTSACFVCRKEQCYFETTLFRTLLTLFFYPGIMYL